MGGPRRPSHPSSPPPHASSSAWPSQLAFVRSHGPHHAGGRRTLLYIVAIVAGTVFIWTSYSKRSFHHAQCNPYDQPGYVSISPTDPHLNRWTPFTTKPACQAPALLASVLRENWKLQPAPGGSEVRAPEGWWNVEDDGDGPDGRGRGWEDVEWAKGKTVLVMGDSVTRFNVKYLCEMAGEPLREIGWNHPWSPPKPDTPPPKPLSETVPESLEDLAASPPSTYGRHRHSHRLKRPHRRNSLTPDTTKRSSSSLHTETENAASSSASGNGTTNASGDLGTGQEPLLKRAAPHEGDKDGYMGHYCHLPGIDLMVIQVFNFGLDEKNFWAMRDDFVPPYTVEDRLSQLAIPYLQAANRPSAAPELTYVGSALWDTTRWMKEDAEAGRDIAEPTSRERILWYRARVRQVLLHTRDLFPRTSLKWLSHHYPLRAMSGWFFDTSGGSSSARPSRPQQKLNRLFPLQQAARSAIFDLDDDVSDVVGEDGSDDISKQAFAFGGTLDEDEKRVLRDVGIANWGDLMLGLEDYQKDDLHQLLLPGGYLWADMMLYDLREAVTVLKDGKKPWSLLNRG
ncbi:hypothetical protein IAU59_000029 [Kwoniella sp. CBS 9459]